MSNEQLLGEIHATVKAIDKRLDEHLDDYKEHERRVETMEKRQVALFAWFTGVGTAVGGSVAAFFHKLTGL